MRLQLWQRMQALATNLGLARLWTQETAPFWRQNGFVLADADALKRLPEKWASNPAEWLTFQLRDEAALERSLDHEFSRFKEEEKARIEKAIRRGRALKFIATLLAVLLALFVLIISAYMIRNRSLLQGR
jgi:hypothetical protein